MGSSLERYIAEQRQKEGDAEHFKRRTMGFATENLHPFIPPKSIGFIHSLGASRLTTTWDGLPDPIKVELAKLQPAVDRLHPQFPYERLADLAEYYKDRIPSEAYFKMAGVAALGQARQLATRERKGQEAGLLFINEAGRQATLGLVPGIPKEMIHGSELTEGDVALAKAMGGIAGIALSGKLVFGALSKVTLLPKAGPLISQLPVRIREATLGMGTMAILDAARPDGLPEEPASIDVSARLAHPLAKFMGNTEAAKRGALALSGAAVGGVIGEALGPFLRGIQEYRVTSTIASKFTPEMTELLRTKLNEAGIGIAKEETSRSVVAKALRNLDRIGQTEEMAGAFAEDQTRTEFILQQLYSNPELDASHTRLPYTRVVDAQGQPLRVYRGETGPAHPTDVQYFAEDPVHANAYTQPLGETEGQRITPAYLDIRRPIDLTGESIDAAGRLISAPSLPNDFLDAYERIAGTREVYSGDVVISPDEVIEAARAAGYDGIRYVVPEAYIPPRTNARKANLTSWIALNPSKQVRSSFSASDDVRLMSGVFRANPEGLSVVKNVQNSEAAAELVKKLGLNVTAVRAGNDYLIMRPKVTFPTRPVGAKLSKQLEDFTSYVRALNRGKPTSRMAILPDGTPVRGDYNAPEMVNRYKLKAPVVEGAEQPELAVREHFGVVDVNVEKGGHVSVKLPSTISQRQSAVLERIADRLGHESEMTLFGARPGQTKLLKGPFGMQVQDALADLVQGASRPKISADVMAKVAQYRREGVFQGQAAHLADGYPVEVIRRVKLTKGRATIVYRDPLTRTIHKAPEETVSVLPTSLEGEHAPTTSFFQAMSPEEQKAFATLRRGINEGLTKPIATFGQLETFAASKGKMATALGKGSVRLHDALTGETQEFENIRAAARFIKESVGPMPDMTTPEIEEVLGYKPNAGGVGGGGPPAGFGEPMPIPDDYFDKAVEGGTLSQLVPGALEQFFSPTKYLMQNLTKRYNLPFEQVWENLHLGTVNRQNFVQAWAEGKGPGLPTGTKPLAEIYKMAGRPDAERQELITDLLETVGDDPKAAQIRSQMTPNEIRAVDELRKWYGVTSEGGLFKTLGVEAEYLTDYAPHIRSTNGAYTNDITEVWRRTRGTALPKAVEFFADYSRDGSLNLYEKRAFIAAMQYLNAGARSRFMNAAMDDAKRLLRAVPDNAVKAPLANFLEALRGHEFAPQRAALAASLNRFMQGLGTGVKVATDVAEKATMGLLGAGYSATIGFRPGLAVRHFSKIWMTMWPLVGRFDDTFAEGLGRALTKAGRDEAIRAGAISVRQLPMFAGEETEEAMPRALSGMYRAGFWLYGEGDMLTRAASFHVAKIQASRALEEFAAGLKSGGTVGELRRDLIKNSGAMVLTKTMQDEFIRLASKSPEAATDLLGRQISNVTEFLYGRGQQPRWMRTVPGRFFGQFGTFALWYFNYVNRSFLNMWRGGYHKEALAFIGKLGLVNLALFEAGKAVGVDVRKWTVGHSLFYSGGPALEAVLGMTDISRGASENFLTIGTPAGKERIARGLRTLEGVGQAFIPNMYAVQDMARLLNAQTPQEKLAALLSTRPTAEYSVQEKMDLLFNPGRLSTDIDLQTGGDKTQTAAELMMQGMKMAKERPRLPVPPAGPIPPPPQEPATRGSGISKLRITTPATVQGRPPMEPTALPPEIRKGESKPIP